MLVVIIIIIITVGTILMANIYSIFYPFIKNMSMISDYNSAYYGAIGSVERGELSLKYHEAGFQGSGGWLGKSKYGISSDYGISNFGKLDKSGNGMFWTISSRVGGTTITVGNIDRNLITAQTGRNEKSYMMMDYKNPEEVAFYYDDTRDKNKMYTKVDPSDIKNIVNDLITISVYTQLNNKMYDLFNTKTTNGGDLDISSDQDGDGATNDIMVAWSIAGEYHDGATVRPFTIIPNQVLATGANCRAGVSNIGGVCTKVPRRGSGPYDWDTNIREKRINTIQQQIYNDRHRGEVEGQLLTGSAPGAFSIKVNNFAVIGDSTVSNYINSKTDLLDMMHDSNIQKVSLKLSLVNKLKTNSGDIYPFLEYFVSLCNTRYVDAYGITRCGTSGATWIVPNRSYNIDGRGRVGDYNIIVRVQKPAFKSSLASDFVILF